MNKRNLSKRGIALFSITLLVLFQVLSFFPQQVDAAVLTNGATISAVDKDGNKILPLTAVEIEEGETAFDLLKEVTEEQDVILDYGEDPNFGAFINSIGSVIPEGDHYWGFMINGEGAQVGASSYVVEKGDSLLFKVISYPAETVDITVSAVDKNKNVVFRETVSVVNGSSAYDALKLAGKTAEVSVDTSIDSEFFAYVNNIGKVELGDYDYWSTYLNDEYMQEGITSTIVKNGDHLKLVVESWGPPPDETGEDEQPVTDGETPEDDTGTEEPKPDQTPVTLEQVRTAVQSTKQYLSKKAINDDFTAIALEVVGGDVPQEYIDRLKEDIIEKEGIYRNVTDYERFVIGLTAAGIDPTNFAGYNLVEKIHSNERMIKQGNNGVIYALLAYDSGNYEIPSDAKWTREKLVNYLLDQQLNKGGWSLFGTSPSVDITGMALAALAPYKEQENVQAAINKAVEWFSSVQDSNGGFSDDTNGGDASETTAQVIIGLASVGVDPTDERFTKQAGDLVVASLDSGASTGVNLIQHLLTFKQSDGGFAHLSGGDTNTMASTQALLALTAYDYLLTDKGSIYRFSKPKVVVDSDEIVDNEVTPTPEKTAEIEESLNEVKQPETKSEATTVVNKKESAQEIVKGQPLPNTATPLFNLLAAGGTLLVIGSTVLVYSNRRQTNKV
ncbi:MULTISPECIES: DUF4430 domain-containing protein [Metabacillus]|uniref:DUF4430 domain-containing protein n=2 Tax=Metabacillus TaxID=2675233 RepID=A0A179T2T1_9BACI|nr:MULTISPECIES: DUF4430 domain-containing protein [Metabacillus]OAS87610.1 hypothetical protein A6K24_19395 [Metabacillus litoralis]QNF26993.1 DUF4430 domain-containing protein [Metabacillus sp. KUDC1714]